MRLRRRVPTTVAALLAVLISLGISACGSTDDTSGTTRPPAAHEQQQADTDNTPTSSTTSPPSAHDQQQADTDQTPPPPPPPPPPPAKKVAPRPGCGEFCQQAGVPQGTGDPGCPDNDSDKCAPCPEDGCVALLTRSARVHDGVFTVTLRCNVDHPCSGAFHVYLSQAVVRTAASDISVLPHETASVDIALTPLGRHIAAYEGELRGYVLLFLEGTGIDKFQQRGVAGENLRLQAARTRLTACDQNISAAQNTSCPFAENVFVAYADKGTRFTAKSPTTGRSYHMACYSDLETVYCIGGNDAFVTFPEKAVDAFR
jgi:hypothetical protein